jgi:phosphoribosyl 1,2-cyclic phosphodiesterase
MRFASLGSGSRGNATLISQGKTTILVDCGFSARETEKRLRRVGLTSSDLTAILVTHEHADHIGGVRVLSQKFNIPVYATPAVMSVSMLMILKSHRFRCHTMRVNPVSLCSTTVISA